MPTCWLAHIDNIASFREGKIIFDIERHFARGIYSSGEIVYTKPRYSFMIDYVGAREGKIFKKPLSASTFKRAVSSFKGYVLEKESEVSLRYTNETKNIFLSWEACVPLHKEFSGNVVGLIQINPVQSLDEVLKKILPNALADWNTLAEKLKLESIPNSVYNALVRKAVKINKSYPKEKFIAQWPKRPIRFLFEQE